MLPVLPVIKWCSDTQIFRQIVKKGKKSRRDKKLREKVSRWENVNQKNVMTNVTKANVKMGKMSRWKKCEDGKKAAGAHNTQRPHHLPLHPLTLCLRLTLSPFAYPLPFASSLPSHPLPPPYPFILCLPFLPLNLSPYASPYLPPGWPAPPLEGKPGSISPLRPVLHPPLRRLMMTMVERLEPLNFVYVDGFILFYFIWDSLQEGADNCKPKNLDEGTAPLDLHIMVLYYRCCSCSFPLLFSCSPLF